MASLRSIFDFLLNADYRFRYRGRRLRVGPDGWHLLKLLARIVAERSQHDNDVGWLLPYRDAFRKTIRVRPLAALVLAVDRSTHPQARRLAIWLLGRCRTRFGASAVARLRNAR